MTTHPEHLSGLPPIESPEKHAERLRLEKSRMWLKGWRTRREAEKQPIEQAAE